MFHATEFSPCRLAEGPSPCHVSPQQLVLHASTTNHAALRFSVHSILPNLVGLLGALGDIDDLEGCSERNRQHGFIQNQSSKWYILRSFKQLRQRNNAIETYQGAGSA